MKLRTSLFLLSISIAFQVSPQSFSSEVEATEKNPFLLGINLPWQHFGRDFGERYDAEFFESAFPRYSSEGVKLVRIWIHCDGRGNPLFDDQGVSGLPEGFMSDMKAMLDLAHENNLKIMPALWSFDMAKDRTHEHGPYAGVHGSLLENSAKTLTYIENVLIPMVKALDAHPALWAWEICNEPEWMEKDHGVSKKAIIRFHAMCAVAIHEHGNKPVTTGSAGIRYSVDIKPGEGNWWSDESLQNEYDKPGAYLDFYQIHTYDWMLKLGQDLFEHTPQGLQLDKPVLIGEAPGKTMSNTRASDGAFIEYSVEDMIRLSVEKGYMGILFWSDQANDGHGDWPTIRAAMRSWKATK